MRGLGIMWPGLLYTRNVIVWFSLVLLVVYMHSNISPVPGNINGKELEK
jgi:hypothetical protein